MRSAIRRPAARSDRQARDIHVPVIERVYREKDIEGSAIPPVALAFLITRMAMGLVREAGTGFTKGHEEIRAMVDRFLETLE